MAAAGQAAVNDFVRRRIRELRIERELKTSDLARRAGIALGSYSCLEAGAYRISLENLFRILTALKVDIREVWPARRGEPPKAVDDGYVKAVICQADGDLRRHRVEVDDVLAAVARCFGLKAERLLSAERSRLSAEARALAAVLAEDFPQIRRVDLARRLRRDISSLSHGAQRLKLRLSERRLAANLSKARRELTKVMEEKAHE